MKSTLHLKKTKKKPLLSAYILTLNNEGIIERCLASLDKVNEVIVVDGGSTDKTREICKKYKNVTVYTNQWSGFPKQRNFALSKCTGDWILYVDSDMEATPQLLDEIHTTIKNPTQKAYYISYYNLFLGTYPLIGGDWFPSWAPMLIKNSPEMRYDETCVVHEGSAYKGEHGYLKNFIIHHNYPTINSMITKMLSYTDLDAEKLKIHKLFGRYTLTMNPKSALSVLKHVTWYPFIYFMWVFFWKRGYKSGIPGFVYAVLGTVYYFLALVKYWDNLCNEQKLKPTMKEAVEKGFKLIK